MLNIALLIKKYSVPTLFGLVGILLFIQGIRTDQSMEFIFASIVILLSSILSFLNVSGIISNKITKIIGFLSLSIAGVVIFITIYSVTKTVTHNVDYKFMKNLSIRNLRDVQTTQKAFFNKYGVYAHNWETIINFIETDSISKVDPQGTVPNRKITEQERDYLIPFGLYKKGQAIDDNMKPIEAYYLSKSDICPPDLMSFRRDTINVSFIETTFTKNRSYMKERKDNEFGNFVAKDLKYIPFTNKKKIWNIDTAMIVITEKSKEEVDGDSVEVTKVLDTIMTFRIEGILPIHKIEGMQTKEVMCLGNILKNDFSGSWEEESIKHKLQLPKSKKLNRKKNKPAPEKKQETDGLLPAAPETEDKNSENK